MKTLEFFKWMVDRHEIFLKKEEGRPKPWTQDKIFLENKFCNPFRENDKTTVWFRENIREPLRDNDFCDACNNNLSLVQFYTNWRNTTKA